MRVMRIPAVAPGHPSGTGVACVASVRDCTYGEARRAFQGESVDAPWDIVRALEAMGLRAAWQEASNIDGMLDEVVPDGTIVLVQGWRYPSGHYLVRTRAGHGWMDPWSNRLHDSRIDFAMAGYIDRLPEMARRGVFLLPLGR